VSEIKKLAQKTANAADKTEQDAISRQVLQLRAEYLSEVAPIENSYTNRQKMQ